MIDSNKYQFNRLEFAGSLGDLGTLLPLAIGMIMINGMEPLGVFFTIGLFYILCGLYYGITVPVQPMKVIGAYAIATALPVSQIMVSGALMSLILLIAGITGLITVIGRYIPKSVVRGVQLSTGALLMAQGVKLMWGTSTYQIIRGAAEPYLSVQNLGPIPIGVIIGAVGVVVTLLMIDNKRIPAGFLIVFGGIVLGLIFGNHEYSDGMHIRINLPSLFPTGFPVAADFMPALLLLVVPQTPMTVGNAVIAYADLSKEYFGKASKRVTYRNTCISMAIGNFLSFVLGGIPLCHGAGGLAAHYRFGARTAGSNIIIGLIFLILAVLLGKHILAVLTLLPMSILGVLLLYAGSQLAMTMIDLQSRKDLFVALVMLGITLASNLAAGFIIGIILAYTLRSERLSV